MYMQSTLPIKERPIVVLRCAVFDGWSVGVLLSELPAAYTALANGEAPQLPPLCTTIVDFAMWERGRLDEAGAIAPQLAYWKQRLAGALQGPVIRGDLPGGPCASSKGGTLQMVVPADLLRSLKSLATACGATLNVAVLAAFKARTLSSIVMLTFE